MAVDADHSLSSAPPDLAAAGDRARVFAAARRHSRVVHILRIVFPGCALLIACFYFLSSGLKISLGNMEASVSRVEISKDRLRMVEPKLEGITDDGGAYMVTADYAEQEVSNPRVVHLTRVHAEVDNSTKGWTRLTAPEGVFDSTTEDLVLTGDIRVATSSGMTSHLTRADVDLKTKHTVSNEPVVVEALNGTINANTMELFMSERRVMFRGDIRVHIYKRPTSGKKADEKQ